LHDLFLENTFVCQIKVTWCNQHAEKCRKLWEDSWRHLWLCVKLIYFKICENL